MPDLSVWLLELRSQILKAEFLPLNLDSAKCQPCDISPSLDFLLGKTRKHCSTPLFNDRNCIFALHGENVQKGKENGVLWPGIQLMWVLPSLSNQFREL